MRKKSLFLMLLLFGVTSLSAQITVVDSLKAEVKKTMNDIEKTRLLNEISDYYKSSNPELMLEYAHQALELALEIKDEYQQGKAYINLGNYNIISGDYAQALHYFSQAKNIFEQHVEELYKKELARVYGSIGIVFSEQSIYGKALEYHLKAVKIYESERETPILARVYNNVGIVYKAQKEAFKALDYFLKAHQIQDSLQDPTIGITTTNIGNIYLDQNNFAKALEYYRLAEEQLQQHLNYRGLGELYNNLGLYYQKNQDNSQALEYWHKALNSFEKVNDKFGMSDTHYYLGGLYLLEKNYSKAIGSTQKAKDLALEVSTLEMLVLAEEQLQNIYEEQSDFRQALFHANQHKVYKDSLINFQNIRKSIQSEMDFEFEKREAVYREEQSKQEAVLKEQAKRHRMQLVSGALIVLLCLGLGFVVYNRNQLKKTLTLQKNLAEYEQKALHLQMNPHVVFNCLGSISSFIVQNGNDSAIKYLSKFSKLMRLTLEYSKEALIPVDKEIEGLQNYLELEQLRFNKAFDFSITKDKNIEDDVALPPLLIQPFVENAIIHGLIPKKEFGWVSVDFSLTDKNLICTITDNGIGLSKSKEIKENSVQVHKSMALDIIKKRLEMMGDSTSKSTTFTIEEIIENGEIKGTKVVLKLSILTNS